VIPPPAARDVPREQQPAAGSVRVSELRAPDPVDGRPPWTLRLARSSTGLLCTTAGQLVGGRFGLIGLDGRFRAYDERIVDSCGERVAGPHASLVGARVFDADRTSEVRTVVTGIGGPRLETATLLSAAGRRPVRVGRDGTFAAAVGGYPEDSTLALELRFAGGRVEFGRSPVVIPDPLGAQAWKLEAGTTSRDLRLCVTISRARANGGPRSPGACGIAMTEGHFRDDWFFAVRRLTADRPSPGGGGFADDGDWYGAPPRTAVWGAAGSRVRQIAVRGPGVDRTVRPNRGGTFLVMLAPTVDPRTLTVTVTTDDGRVERRRGDANLLFRAVPRR
jgi:hypothetical protein